MRGGAFDLVLANHGHLADGVDGSGAGDVDRKGEMDAVRGAVGVGLEVGHGGQIREGLRLAVRTAHKGRVVDDVYQLGADEGCGGSR